MAPRRIVTSEDEDDRAPAVPLVKALAMAPRIIPASARAPASKAPHTIKPIASTSKRSVPDPEDGHSSELSPPNCPN